MSESLFYHGDGRCPLDGGSARLHRMRPTQRRRFERPLEFYDSSIYLPSEDGGFSDLSLVEVAVCDRCAFASADDRYFKVDSRYVDPIEIGRDIAPSLADPERIALATEATDLQGFPRSLADAIIALRLAYSTSRRLHQAGGRRFAGEIVRAAQHAAAIAWQTDRAGLRDLQKKWSSTAIDTFEEALRGDIKAATRGRCHYLVTALAIRTGEDRVAVQSVARLREFDRAESHPEIKSYLARAQRILDDREYFGPGTVLLDVEGMAAPVSGTDEGRAAAPEAAGPPSESRSILVVDDSPSMRRILVNILDQMGLENVVEASDGQEALRSFLRVGARLILLDWHMPGLDGLETLLQIRQVAPRVPIVMVTSEKHRARILEAIKAGANDYIVKPYEARVVREKIEALLDREAG